GADAPFVRQRDVAAYVHGETGLDGPDLPPPNASPRSEHAVEFLAEHFRAHPEATLVAIGPLTNVGLAFATHPGARPARIVLMGGAIGEGNRTPAAEFNIWADPDAARRVCTSGLDVTMVGLDVTHQALFTRDECEAIRGRGVAGRLTAELVDYYARAHPHMAGTPIHDAVAVAQVIDPSLLTLEHCHLEVDCGTVSRGRTLVDQFHVTGREPNVHVATAIDPAFTAWMSERIASLG
ncbi:MAG TPA: nucleoside hydrolase, partial [Gaiellales bacterium]